MGRSRLRTRADFGIVMPRGAGGGGSRAPSLMNKVAQVQHAAAAMHPPIPMPNHPLSGPAPYILGRVATPMGAFQSMGSVLAANTGLNAPSPIGPQIDQPLPGTSPAPDPSGGGGEQAPTPDAAPQAQAQDGDSPMPTDVAPDDGGYYTEEQQPAETYSEETPTEGTESDPGVTDANYYGDPVVQPKVSFPLVNCFVRNGHLRTMAILQTPEGVTPLTSCIPIMGYEIGDGYVHFGAEAQHPGIGGAVMATRAKLLQQAEHERIRLECESLVRRSRQGDQNATALLAGLAENAKKGDQRARYAYTCARKYIQHNPANADIGAEGSTKKLSYWTSVTLANGAPLTKSRIHSLAGTLNRPEDVEAFLHGLIYFNQSDKLRAAQKSLDSDRAKVLELGRAIGEARALQMARKPGVPLRFFDKAVAWEFGE